MGKNFKLKKGRFKLYIKKKCFMMRMVSHWNTLSRETVDALSLEVLQIRLDRAMSNLI